MHQIVQMLSGSQGSTDLQLCPTVWHGRIVISKIRQVHTHDLWVQSQHERAVGKSVIFTYICTYTLQIVFNKFFFLFFFCIL